jgi:hypothetical protein
LRFGFQHHKGSHKFSLGNLESNTKDSALSSNQTTILMLTKKDKGFAERSIVYRFHCNF